jgi:hypothetical protein
MYNSAYDDARLSMARAIFLIVDESANFMFANDKIG